MRKFKDERRRHAANDEGDEARYGKPRNKLEERYSSHGGGFNRKDKYGRDKARRDERRASIAADEVESENPLAIRRNEAALKSIVGRMPSLGKPGVKMRPRNKGNQ